MRSQKNSWWVDTALVVSFVVAFGALLSMLYCMLARDAVGTVVSIVLLFGGVAGLVHIVTKYG